ncbi:pyroglutamyl-peptidase [Trichophyton mentagrophytes]|nr:pyroglutamyl-peptidase [Trichophyton mentagrophytes]
MGDFGASSSLDEPVSLPGQPVPPQDDDIHVLVTGFGPFKTHPLNPSWLINSLLPQYATTSKNRRVHIHAHPRPIRVAYAAVREEMPRIIEEFRVAHSGHPPHLVIHIGMAATRQYYAVETVAHREGYKHTDVDGQFGIPFEASLPERLQPGVSTPSDPASTSESTDKVKVVPSPLDTGFLQTWRKSLPAGRSIDVRLSHDAGHYLCEYIYYTSLSMAWEENRPRAALFLHVPGWTDKASVEMGVEVVVGLVRAMVESWIVETDA